MYTNIFRTYMHESCRGDRDRRVERARVAHARVPPRGEACRDEAENSADATQEWSLRRRRYAHAAAAPTRAKLLHSRIRRSMPGRRV